MFREVLTLMRLLDRICVARLHVHFDTSLSFPEYIDFRGTSEGPSASLKGVPALYSPHISSQNGDQSTSDPEFYMAVNELEVQVIDTHRPFSLTYNIHPEGEAAFRAVATPKDVIRKGRSHIPGGCSSCAKVAHNGQELKRCSKVSPSS